MNILYAFIMMVVYRLKGAWMLLSYLHENHKMWNHSLFANSKCDHQQSNATGVVHICNGIIIHLDYTRM